MDRPTDRRRDPDPERAVAVCLDLDGTVHPRGSVFVTVAALLPWELDLPAAARADLRDCLASAAAYAGGPAAGERARGVVRLLDGARRIAPGAARVLAAGLLRRSFEGRLPLGGGDGGGDGGDRGREGTPAAPAGDYDRLRTEALSAYAAALDGRRPDAVDPAVRRVVARHAAVTPRWRRLVGRLTDRADVYLVTDVPAHAARPYFRRVGGDPAKLRATRLSATDGRYDGGVAPPDKRATVAALDGYDCVVAAGDAAVDAAMAEPADLLLAVDGEGDVASALDGDEPTADAVARDPSLLGQGVVRAGGAADVAAALRAAGVL